MGSGAAARPPRTKAWERGDTAGLVPRPLGAISSGCLLTQRTGNPPSPPCPPTLSPPSQCSAPPQVKLTHTAKLRSVRWPCLFVCLFVVGFIYPWSVTRPQSFSSVFAAFCKIICSFHKLWEQEMKKRQGQGSGSLCDTNSSFLELCVSGMQ